MDAVDREELLRLASVSTAAAEELDRLARQPSRLSEADWRGAAALAAAGAAALLHARMLAAAHRAHQLGALAGRLLAAMDPAPVLSEGAGRARAN